MWGCNGNTTWLFWIIIKFHWWRVGDRNTITQYLINDNLLFKMSEKRSTFASGCCGNGRQQNRWFNGLCKPIHIYSTSLCSVHHTNPPMGINPFHTVIHIKIQTPATRTTDCPRKTWLSRNAVQCLVVCSTNFMKFFLQPHYAARSLMTSSTTRSHTLVGKLVSLLDKNTLKVPTSPVFLNEQLYAFSRQWRGLEAAATSSGITRLQLSHSSEKETNKTHI